ncbi:MAG: hypothetical protein U9P79_00230 [Candidatus Cloacimonadota bacterium]|nr:hypothetical protein [Candidatus Cloacimonadota bacterium]
MKIWMKRLLFGSLFVLLFVNIVHAADFRNLNWGMSMMEVKNSEIAKLLDESDSSLSYQDIIAEMDCTIEYKFYKEQLIDATYLFENPHIDRNFYIRDFKKLKDILTQKYGNSNKQTNKVNVGEGDLVINLNYISDWSTPETEIQLFLLGDNAKISLKIYYSSVEINKLREVESEQNLLENF